MPFKIGGESQSQPGRRVPSFHSSDLLGGRDIARLYEVVLCQLVSYSPTHGRSSQTLLIGPFARSFFDQLPFSCDKCHGATIKVLQIINCYPNG
jgi:hypothetical protein